MSRVDEIRARSLTCEGEMCGNLRYLLALLDKRTEALREIATAYACTGACEMPAHVFSRTAREALADDSPAGAAAGE